MSERASKVQREPVDDDLLALMRILARAIMRPKKLPPEPGPQQNPRP